LGDIGFGSLGGILPELIIVLGGLLILVLDIAQADRQDSGRGYLAVSVLFLIVGLTGVLLQIGMEPYIVLSTTAIDPFATYLKLVIYTGMILVAIGGGSYMNRHATGRGEFWALFLFVTAAMSFAVSATNLLLLYLSIEFLSITSYILAGFLRTNKRSAEAGLKYFLYGSVAAAVMLYGMSLLYGATGSLDLGEIAQGLAANAEMAAIIPAATLLTLVGLGFKASLAPFYQWAPDVYDGAPTPITAYLSTASKAVGFAVMARVFVVALGAYRVEWAPILAGLSVLTMTVGNVIALRQTSVKRMLAYSSVAQAGYILMGLAAVVSSQQADLTVLGMNGLNGLLLYLFAYLFTNIGAFLVVLAVEDETGSTELGAYSNLVQRAPGMAWAMFIFLLSLAGIPLTGGFVGKFYVFGAAVQHQYFWLAGVGLVNAAIAAYYYLNVVRTMFFASDGEAATGRMAAPVAIQSVVLLCVLATIWIGLYPPRLLEWANSASRQLLALML